MSNKFLDQTLTLHEYCINKLQGSKSELYITLIILLSPDYEYPQHKTRFLFFRTGEMLEGSKERIEEWTVVMGVSTQILVSSSPGLPSHLLISVPPPLEPR